MRSRLEREGLGSFEPHEVIELLLFYCIPMGDVNPLAHSLIARFGTVDGVLCAPVDALMGVHGMGSAAANWLASLKPLLDAYLSCNLIDRPRLISPAQAARYASQLQGEMPGAGTWIVALTGEGHLLGCIPVAPDSEGEKTDIDLMNAFLLRCHAEGALIIRRCPPGQMRIEHGDRALVEQLEASLTPHKIRLMDALIVSGADHISLWQLGHISPSPERSTDRAAERYTAH